MNITNGAQRRNTILAALRFYQAQGMGDPANRADDIHDIATNGDEDISLDAAGIDQLCEDINTNAADVLAYDPDTLRILDGNCLKVAENVLPADAARFCAFDVPTDTEAQAAFRRVSEFLGTMTGLFDDEDGVEIKEAVRSDLAVIRGALCNDPALSGRMALSLANLHGLLSEAMTAHIYNEDNGEAPEADCRYTAGLKEADALITELASGDMLKIEVHTSGGTVSGVFTNAAVHHAEVIVIDFDTDGAERYRLSMVNIANGAGDGWERATINEYNLSAKAVVEPACKILDASDPRFDADFEGEG